MERDDLVPEYLPRHWPAEVAHDRRVTVQVEQAAEACFGTPEWPADRLVPQASIEFEVENSDAVASAGGELQRAGLELLHPARTEPWGQTVTRLLTDDGLIIGISYAPALHDEQPA